MIYHNTTQKTRGSTHSAAIKNVPLLIPVLFNYINLNLRPLKDCKTWTGKYSVSIIYDLLFKSVVRQEWNYYYYICLV